MATTSFIYDLVASQLAESGLFPRPDWLSQQLHQKQMTEELDDGEMSARIGRIRDAFLAADLCSVQDAAGVKGQRLREYRFEVKKDFFSTESA
jgi:hypothetical protein